MLTTKSGSGAGVERGAEVRNSGQDRASDSTMERFGRVSVCKRDGISCAKEKRRKEKKRDEEAVQERRTIKRHRIMEERTKQGETERKRKRWLRR